MRTYTQKNTRGFTLIEIVVVIVILGILAAVGAFAYQNIVADSRKMSDNAVIGQFSKDVYGEVATSNSNAIDAANKASGLLYTNSKNSMFSMYVGTEEVTSPVTNIFC